MKNTILFLVTCLTYSCQPSISESSPFDHLGNEDVKLLLQKGIEASGGLDAWQNLGSHTFQKDAILYLEDGTIDSESLNQTVTFNNFPSLSGRIKSSTDSTETTIIYTNGNASIYVNGVQSSEADNDAARLSFLGAHIVMSMPFKLLDPGVKLSYGGKGTQYGKAVEILIADYDADEPNHTKTHRWWHYFDANDYSYLGYKVYHPPTYALIENISTTIFKGISFPLERTTWRVDEHNQKEYIRGKFSYSNFR